MKQKWDTTVLVGQSGGPTAAINASLVGVWEAAHRLGARVVGMRNGIEGFLAGTTVDLDAIVSDPLQAELLRHTPASFLGSCRYKLPDPEDDTAPYQELFSRFEALGAGAVLYIGGNDSMDTIEKLARYGESAGSPIRFMGVAKTIDNDLMGTDHAPGYGSAAKFVATSVHELRRDSDTYFMKSVTVVEIMGRDAGWLTAAAALAGAPGQDGPDLFLLPEAPVSLDDIVSRVEELFKTQNTIIIAASEGARTPTGEPLYQDESVGVDAFGHVAAQSGLCRYLAGVIKERLGVKARAVELSTLQRCAAHLASATDLAEAATLGSTSLQAAASGATGMLSVIHRISDDPYAVRYGLKAISDVANGVRTIPRSWITPDGMGLTQVFLDYARPLIAGEVHPIFVDGVPWYPRLAKE